MRTGQPKIIELLKGLLLGFLVIVGTFPENDWVYSTGIDYPLSWAFNFIYENDLSIGKGIIFPHGPLAFFMYPLPSNIITATLATAILKVLLVFNIFWVLEKKENYSWLIAFVLAYFISLISPFNQLIFANIILLYCNYFNQRKLSYKLLAFVLTAFAFFIKSNIAVISGIACFSFLLYFLVRYKNYKKTAIDIITNIGLLFLLWFIMYGTFFGLINYTVGMFQLAQDNSSAVSYYPYNNWLVLTVFLIIVFILPFINRSEKSIFFGAIIILSYFAVWKHGMAREDVSHVYNFLIYLIISLLLSAVFNPVFSYKNIVLSIIAIFLFQYNMQYAFNYTPANYNLFQVTNFTEFISDFSELKTKSVQQSQNNISSNKLPQAILDSINSKTVDVYPWDYSFIAANNLNWQPRPVIQSYASYTSWLDNKNAEHLKSEKAPSFMIWELNKNTLDFNGSDFNSLDRRYILNDEPFTVVEIIKNYKLFYADNKVLIFKKRITPVKSTQSIIEKNNQQWGQWMNVPESTHSLLRAKLTFNKSLLQRLKRFFYKDEQFWVYLKLKNGLIHRYRIVPENAKDGIWINPYIYNSDEHYQIKQVMFQCSNKRIMTKNLVVEWENTEFENESNCISKLFNLNNLYSDQLELLSLNTFESPEVPNWNKLEEAQTSGMFHSGTKSHLVNESAFSSTFRYPLDSISFGDLKISTDCWIKSPDYKYSGNISVILTINDSSGSIVYKSLSVDEQLIDQNHWNNVLNSINYKHNQSNCTLGVYIWNISGKDLYIDNFRIMVNSKKQISLQKNN